MTRLSIENNNPCSYQCRNSRHHVHQQQEQPQQQRQSENDIRLETVSIRMSITSILNTEQVTLAHHPALWAGDDKGSSFRPAGRTEGYDLGSPTTRQRRRAVFDPSSSKPPRARRHKYSDEEAYFIWYHRTDLEWQWDRVLARYNQIFECPRGKDGLQCKFYRLLGEWGVEKVREQARQNQHNKDRIGQFGVVERTGLRFPWMTAYHQQQHQLPMFAHRDHPRRISP